MIHTTLWLPLLNGCCKRLFWHCIVFWWPLLLRRDHYCSEAKTWPNVLTVSWDIYDPIPKFHLNMMRVKTSLLSLRAGFTCASSKKIFGGRAAIPWGDWGQGTHFSLAHSPCGMAAPLPRNSLFLGPFSSQDGGSAPKIFSKLAQASLLAGYRGKFI